MSKFRRIAWMKWPRPIPYPSPSPPVTMTFSSGFASLAPSATGSARPWIAWNPYVDRKCGRLLEQPMPETTRMFHGSSWSAWTAVWRARNTAKSPHPGHQVGLISDLYVSISKAAFMRPPRGSCPRCPATTASRSRRGTSRTRSSRWSHEGRPRDGHVPGGAQADLVPGMRRCRGLARHHVPGPADAAELRHHLRRHEQPDLRPHDRPGEPDLGEGDEDEVDADRGRDREPDRPDLPGPRVRRDLCGPRLQRGREDDGGARQGRD